MTKGFLIFIVMFCGTAWAQEEPPPFLNGIQAYRNNDFQKAKEIFSQMVQDNPDNPTLLYNLGLAEYHLGRMGLALGLWRKARTLNPEGIPVEQAISFTEEQLFPNQRDKTFISTIYITLLKLPLWVWWLASLVSFTAAGWWSLEYGVKKRLMPNLWPSWLFFVFPFFIFTTIFATLDYLDHTKVSATVVAKELSSRAGPSETSPELGQLSEGQLVKVEKMYQNWVQIRTQTGSPGWVPQNAVIQFKGR